MIDGLAILFSTAMVVFALFRSFQIDRREPWFQATPLEESDLAVKPEKKKRARRHRYATPDREK